MKNINVYYIYTDNVIDFSFWIPITLAKICFFLIVVTFAKIHLY